MRREMTTLVKQMVRARKTVLVRPEVGLFTRTSMRGVVNRFKDATSREIMPRKGERKCKASKYRAGV